VLASGKTIKGSAFFFFFLNAGLSGKQTKSELEKEIEDDVDKTSM